MPEREPHSSEPAEMAIATPADAELAQRDADAAEPVEDPDYVAPEPEREAVAIGPEDVAAVPAEAVE